MTHPPFTLTDGELRIVAQLCAGATSKQIAADLGTTPTALLGRLSRIRKRFAAANNEQLIAILFRRGLQQ